VAYIPDFEPLADALKRVMATGISQDEAKLDLCRAVGDKKINFRVRIAQNDDRFGGKWFPHRNVGVPSHLSTDDLDWSRSCPLKAWPIGPVGPESYEWVAGWKDRPIDLLELSTNDVSRILCGSHSDGTDSKEAHRTAVTTVGQETKAIHALATHLKENPNLKRKEAVTWCRNQGFALSGRGFQDRVWPDAREAAGLTKKSPTRA
jgi:hypothetical protein